MSVRSPLIRARDLAEVLGEVSLLDVRWRLGGPPGREEFLSGHLPGAAYVDLDCDLADPPGDLGRHPLPDPTRFAEAMRRCGVSPDRAVVVYDAAGGRSAARCWWLLRHHGHQDVRVLDGGYPAWVEHGGAVEQGESTVFPGNFAPRLGEMPLLDAASAQRMADEGVLIDAREPERFRGESEPVDAVAGHIPGACNVPTSRNLAGAVGDALARFRTADELASVYAEVADGRAVGVYCGSGVTAAHGVLALELIGVEAALYAGSWSEWITDPDRPVATGGHRG